MSHSTTQPISIRPSPPIKADFHHPLRVGHTCSESESDRGNSEGGDDDSVQDLSMDSANRSSSAAWDGAPAASVGLSQIDSRYFRPHHTPSSLQFGNTNKGLRNNEVDNSLMHAPIEFSIPSCVTQGGSARAGSNRLPVSIDTSPVGLQRGSHLCTNIQAVPSSVEMGQQKEILDQASDPARQPYPVSWPRQEAKSQLSLGLSNNGACTTKSDSPSIGLLDPSLLSSNPSAAIEETTDKPTETFALQRKSSLTWRLPSQSKAQPVSCSPVIDNKVFVASPNRLSNPDDMGEHSPSIPIKRLCRSKSASSFSSKGASSPLRSSNHSFPTPVVTSSSYSSLPYSPATAFLSNFADMTAPVAAPDEEGSQVGNYVMGKIIGYGGFSTVREATAIDLNDSSTAACVAVKIVKTQTGARDNDRIQRMLEKEITIWSQVSHPNILPFITVERLPTDTFIFCELCTGGHLLHYLTYRNAPSPTSPGPQTTQPLSEDEARGIFNQIAEAVRYLHEEKRIVHRDIKLENILQHESGTWKLCDFGLAEYQDEEAAACFGDSLVPSRRAPTYGGSELTCDINKDSDEDEIKGGSLAYSSPEQLRCNKPLRCPLQDIWSLGVVLYALLTGKLPFQDEYEPRLQLQILNGRYEEPMDCSPEARDLLKNMFRLKPEDRWDIGQVRDSRWCTGTGDIDPDHSRVGTSEPSLNFPSFRNPL